MPKVASPKPYSSVLFAAGVLAAAQGEYESGFAHFKKNRGLLVLELEDRGKLSRRPALQAARRRVATHADLLKRRLDLVKRELAAFGKGKPGAEEDRR